MGIALGLLAFAFCLVVGWMLLARWTGRQGRAVDQNVDDHIDRSRAQDRSVNQPH